jgi:Flp pilus assembly protein TadB
VAASHFDCSVVTPLELAIYAAEVKLIMTGLAFLAAVFFAAALLFAFFFGTVNPRLRRTVRRGKRLRDENAALRTAIRSLKGELASGSGRIAALEKMVATFEREVHRLDGVRKRSDSSLLETKALLARLQDGGARVDGH